MLQRSNTSQLISTASCCSIIQFPGLVHADNVDRELIISHTVPVLHRSVENDKVVRF